MTSKCKKNEVLELHASPTQPHAEDVSANHAADHDKIRYRAYEIYLEGGGLSGRELDDWLEAERELQKVALFTRDRDGFQHRRSANFGDGN